MPIAGARAGQDVIGVLLRHWTSSPIFFEPVLPAPARMPNVVSRQEGSREHSQIKRQPAALSFALEHSSSDTGSTQHALSILRHEDKSIVRVAIKTRDAVLSRLGERVRTPAKKQDKILRPLRSQAAGIRLLADQMTLLQIGLDLMFFGVLFAICFFVSLEKTR